MWAGGSPACGRRRSETVIRKHKHHLLTMVFVFVDHCLARPREARSASPQRVTRPTPSRQRTMRALARMDSPFVFVSSVPSL